MLALSRPPVASSPLPSSRYGPSPNGPSRRATSASARMLTTLARSLASWPSGRSGWLLYRAVVMITPSTASPRNSSRSLVGRPPFSYAYERWVSARSFQHLLSGAGGAGGGLERPGDGRHPGAGVGADQPRRVRHARAQLRRVGRAMADHDGAGHAEQDGRAGYQLVGREVAARQAD